MFTMCNAGLNACWDRTATAQRRWTEQKIKLGDVHYQTEPKLSIFPKEILSTTTSVFVRIFFQQ